MYLGTVKNRRKYHFQNNIFTQLVVDHILEKIEVKSLIWIPSQKQFESTFVFGFILSKHTSSVLGSHVCFARICHRAISIIYRLRLMTNDCNDQTNGLSLMISSYYEKHILTNSGAFLPKCQNKMKHACKKTMIKLGFSIAGGNS